MLESPKQSPQTEEKDRNPEKILYDLRSKRDLAVTAVPGIIWREVQRNASEIETKKTPENSFDTKKEPTNEDLEVKMLELYALSQEYILKPKTIRAAEREEKITSLSALSETDDEFLKNLSEILSNKDIKQSEKTETAINDGEKTEEELLAKMNLKNRQKIKSAIIELMSDSRLRVFYEAETKKEKNIRKSSATKEKLKEIIDIQVLQKRLNEESRRLRVEEFLAREEKDGITRIKTPGQTAVALEKIRRGISLAQNKEKTLVGNLSASRRGLLVTENLLRKKDELDKNGFVLSPSREKLISEIIELTSQGFRVFLGGPTGTGKTTVALFALKEMTDGNYNWITWTGETGVRDLFGSPKLTVNEEGKTISGINKGPVTKAVIGEKQGLLHEEFTSGQTGVQMSIKTLWASRPGEQINLPGFNGMEFTKEQIVELATGNLKSKRHQERETMDPAVSREFKALEVSFMPANEMRDDLILPMIIDRSGVLPISRIDVEMIDQFCKAAELSQMAYLEEIPDEVKRSDLYKVISPTGDDVSLTNVFFDTGNTKDIFAGWRASGKPLEMYMMEGLRRFVDQNPHFREAENEKRVIKNILRAYGFNLDADSPNFFSIPLKTNPVETNDKPYLTPSELYFLIPGLPPSDENEFTGGEDLEALHQKEQLLKDIKKLKAEVERSGKLPKTERRASPDTLLKKMELAQEILGKDFMGPEKIEKAFGIKIAIEDIPDMPYTPDDLEKAKENGEMLVLGVDKDSEGNFLTIAHMLEMIPELTDPATGEKVKTLYGQEKAGGKLASDCWYRNEPFYTGINKDGTPIPEVHPRLKWRLTSKAPLPESITTPYGGKAEKSTNYIEQTKILREYLASVGSLTEDEAKECSDKVLAEINELVKSNWQEAARRLSLLTVNKNHRRLPSEALYDILLSIKGNNERILEKTYDWTATLSSNGGLVGLGGADRSGVDVGSDGPGGRDDLGVVSLR